MDHRLAAVRAPLGDRVVGLDARGAQALVAARHAQARRRFGQADDARPLLFRLVTTSFMQRGADLRFLSAFPVEAEYLYQPLTFLRPTGKRVEVEITNKDIEKAIEGKRTLRVTSLTFTVVEVEPLH